MTDYAPRAYPVEFLTLNRAGRGARVRATVELVRADPAREGASS